MNKLICIIFALISTLLVVPPNNTYAQNNWAQVVVVGEYLYRTSNADSTYTNVICYLPSTYYVQIVFEYDDFYKVNFNTISGYVKKSAIKRVSGTPQNPYPNNIKLTTYNKNCYMRSTPTQTALGNDIMLVPANSTSIQYIGSISGSRIEDFGDNTWYYVAFAGKYGYIFSGYISTDFVVYPNDENLPLLATNTQLINPLSDSTVVIIIILLLLPMLVILYLMYHKRRTPSKQKIKHKIVHDDIV